MNSGKNGSMTKNFNGQSLWAGICKEEFLPNPWKSLETHSKLLSRSLEQVVKETFIDLSQLYLLSKCSWEIIIIFILKTRLISQEHRIALGRPRRSHTFIGGAIIIRLKILFECCLLIYLPTCFLQKTLKYIVKMNTQVFYNILVLYQIRTSLWSLFVVIINLWNQGIWWKL